MKYLLFGFSRYYPGGGMFDHEGTFDTEAEAKRAAEKYEQSHLLKINDDGSFEWIVVSPYDRIDDDK